MLFKQTAGQGEEEDMPHSGLEPIVGLEPIEEGVRRVMCKGGEVLNNLGHPLTPQPPTHLTWCWHCGE